jgi:hypothetical protein
MKSFFKVSITCIYGLNSDQKGLNSNFLSLPNRSRTNINENKKKKNLKRCAAKWFRSLALPCEGLRCEHRVTLQRIALNHRCSCQ